MRIQTLSDHERSLIVGMQEGGIKSSRIFE